MPQIKMWVWWIPKLKLSMLVMKGMSKHLGCLIALRNKLLLSQPHFEGVWGWHSHSRKGDFSQPHFGLSVRMKFTLSKVGTWSPKGLPRIQSSSSKVKTPWIEVFFIPLERSWNVDVRNALVWVIWTSEAQVMGKRKAGSQTGSLTSDH
jgi:hypothetical protein